MFVTARIRDPISNPASSRTNKVEAEPKDKKSRRLRIRRKVIN
jgi:hypothetical protein